jgi:hypothetical protein
MNSFLIRIFLVGQVILLANSSWSQSGKEGYEVAVYYFPNYHVGSPRLIQTDKFDRYKGYPGRLCSMTTHLQHLNRL